MKLSLEYLIGVTCVTSSYSRDTSDTWHWVILRVIEGFWWRVTTSIYYLHSYTRVHSCWTYCYSYMIYENLQIWYPRSKIVLLLTGRRVVVESIRISNWEWYPTCTIFRQLGFVVCRLDWRTDVRVGYAFWNYHVNRCYFCNATDSRDSSTCTLTQSDTWYWVFVRGHWGILRFDDESLRAFTALVQVRVQDTRTSRSDIRGPRWLCFPSHFAQDDGQTLFLNTFKIYIYSCKFM
jgi:hypothetical protein